MPHLVSIPARLTLHTAIELANRIDNLPLRYEYVFDFSEMDWAEPFAMLFISDRLNKLRETTPWSKIIARDKDEARVRGRTDARS